MTRAAPSSGQPRPTRRVSAARSVQALRPCHRPWSCSRHGRRTVEHALAPLLGWALVWREGSSDGPPRPQHRARRIARLVLLLIRLLRKVAREDLTPHHATAPLRSSEALSGRGGGGGCHCLAGGDPRQRQQHAVRGREGEQAEQRSDTVATCRPPWPREHGREHGARWPRPNDGGGGSQTSTQEKGIEWWTTRAEQAGRLGSQNEQPTPSS